MEMNNANKIKIAARNVIKNSRRSMVTISMIAIGFLALSIFEGYFTYIYKTLEDQAIVAERLGHLTITKTDYYDKWSLDPHKYMFSVEELQKVENTLSSINSIVMVSPRVSVNGLVSNGDISRIFLAEGITAEDLQQLRGEKYADLPGTLKPGEDYQAVFGSKLAELLGLEEGSDAVLLTSTIDGMVNAMDTTVGEVANTGSVGTNDKFLLLPLALARKLFDFEGADKIVILLDSKGAIVPAREEITRLLKEKGLDIEIKDWKELSAYYGQVKSLFDMMYLFISVVVAIVVTAGVMNTMGMSISERTREIGTLRAIGMRVSSLTKLFVIEGALIVLIGCAAGIVLTYGIGGLINASDITYTPPDSSAEAELIIEIVFENIVGSVFTLTVLAGIASYFPASRATKKPIVDALTHV